MAQPPANEALEFQTRERLASPAIPPSNISVAPPGPSASLGNDSSQPQTPSGHYWPASNESWKTTDSQVTSSRLVLNGFRNIWNVATPKYTSPYGAPAPAPVRSQAQELLGTYGSATINENGTLQGSASRPQSPREYTTSAVFSSSQPSESRTASAVHQNAAERDQSFHLDLRASAALTPPAAIHSMESAQIQGASETVAPATSTAAQDQILLGTHRPAISESRITPKPRRPAIPRTNTRKVAELKNELMLRGLSPRGLKPVLLARLAAAEAMDAGTKNVDIVAPSSDSTSSTRTATPQLAAAQPTPLCSNDEATLSISGHLREHAPSAQVEVTPAAPSYQTYNGLFRSARLPSSHDEGELPCAPPVRLPNQERHQSSTEQSLDERHRLALDESRADFEAATARRRSQSRDEMDDVDSDDDDAEADMDLSEEEADDETDDGDKASESEQGTEIEEDEDSEAAVETEADQEVEDGDDFLEFGKSLRKAQRVMGELSFVSSNDSSQKLTISKGRSPAQAVGRPPGTKGPRRMRQAAKVTPDIKRRLAIANNAWLKFEVDEAIEIVTEIIRINPEIYEAWNILACARDSQNMYEHAILAKVCGASLKHGSAAIQNDCAKYIQYCMDLEPGRYDEYLPYQLPCYRAALSADVHNLEARENKAYIELDLGHSGQAKRDFAYLVGDHPLNTVFVRQLAECLVDEGDFDAAIKLYQDTIAKFRDIGDKRGSKKVVGGDAESNDAEQHTFGWDEIDLYISLFTNKESEDAIKELKSVSRWICGRESEQYWDAVIEDDREWDMEDTRRLEVPEFTPGAFPLQAYGESLPFELRAKIGIHRLRNGNHKEALRHFECLDPSDRSGRNEAEVYPEIFRFVADRLHASKLFPQALEFYRALAKGDRQSDASLQLQMGLCLATLRAEGKENPEAEKCFLAAIELDEKNIPARGQLARMYEVQDKHDEALTYIREIIALQKVERSAPSEPFGASYEWDMVKPGEGGKRRKGKLSGHAKYGPLAQANKAFDDTARSTFLQSQYIRAQAELEGMRNGQPDSTNIWMECAKDLTEDFRGHRKFYPYDKSASFEVYLDHFQHQEDNQMNTDLAAITDRLSRSKHLKSNIDHRPVRASSAAVTIPADYRGIPIQDWLNLFLEYALCLAKNHDRLKAYELCDSAKEAVVFYHCKQDVFLIHMCLSICALICNDEERMIATSRIVMKDYQFTPDAYKFIGTLARLCQSPLSWYMAGPTQKFMLRQIKAMDWALLEPHQQAGWKGGERAGYTARDETGMPVLNRDLDIDLLMLYGHILYCGNSFPYALNYFYRAYALDPKNHIIVLSIGLAYIHHALKRQADNRQNLAIQGLTFVLEYYALRKDSMVAEERQEAHFNLARVYQILGLTHLALPYYLRVLDESDIAADSREDLVIDTAYNLQLIYTTAGNQKAVRDITNRYLVC